VLPHAQTEIRRHDPAVTDAPARAAAEQGWLREHSSHFKPGLQYAVRDIRPPEAVSPFVAYLASDACTMSGEAFAVGCGRFARIFVGETVGWVAPDRTTDSVEDIAMNIGAVRSTESYSIPENLYEEIELMATTVGVWLISLNEFG
jgi:hypothetical protein